MLHKILGSRPSAIPLPSFATTSHASSPLLHDQGFKESLATTATGFRAKSLSRFVSGVTSECHLGSSLLQDAILLNNPGLLVLASRNTDQRTRRARHMFINQASVPSVIMYTFCNFQTSRAVLACIGRNTKRKSNDILEDGIVLIGLIPGTSAAATVACTPADACLLPFHT